MKTYPLTWAKDCATALAIPEVDYGAYYPITAVKRQHFAHELWLFPVTEYVFVGYLKTIFIKVQE